MSINSLEMRKNEYLRGDLTLLGRSRFNCRYGTAYAPAYYSAYYGDGAMMGIHLLFPRGYLSSEWSRVVKGVANAESEASLDEPAERTTLQSRGNMSSLRNTPH
jgi:hypothetical protein